MNIVLTNKGVLSLIDINTMGDSIKRLDNSKIGQFDSGLKYAMSILYRNGIKVEIWSDGVKYTFSSTTKKDELTDKIKELLVVNQDIDGEIIEHCTAFSPNLGYEWKIWMAIRELYSNCLDEGGDVTFVENVEDVCSDNITRIVIYDNSLLEDIISNWDLYFLRSTPIYGDGNVSIFINKEDHLRIYKNTILIHEDKLVKSSYVYDCKHASIDEMRLLNNFDGSRSDIGRCISSSKAVSFIEDFLNKQVENTFETSLSFYWGMSKEWKEIVNRKFEDGTLTLCANLQQDLAEKKEFKIGIKRISYDSPSSNWNKSEIKQVVEKELTFNDNVLNICRSSNIEVPYPIEESVINPYTCIPNIREKVIYVSKEFKMDNMWEMVKAITRIEGNDDTDYIFKKYVKEKKL